MDTVYSLTLGASILLAALSFVAGLLGLAERTRGSSRARGLFRLAAPAAMASMAFLSLSVAAHLAFGHRPGTEHALGFAAFLGEHPAFPAVALASFALFQWFQRRAQST